MSRPDPRLLRVWALRGLGATQAAPPALLSLPALRAAMDYNQRSAPALLWGVRNNGDRHYVAPGDPAVALDVARFQQLTGLPVTGQVNQLTQHALWTYYPINTTISRNFEFPDRVYEWFSKGHGGVTQLDLEIAGYNARSGNWESKRGTPSSDENRAAIAKQNEWTARGVQWLPPSVPSEITLTARQLLDASRVNYQTARAFNWAVRPTAARPKPLPTDYSVALDLDAFRRLISLAGTPPGQMDRTTLHTVCIYVKSHTTVGDALATVFNTTAVQQLGNVSNAEIAGAVAKQRQFDLSVAQAAQTAAARKIADQLAAKAAANAKKDAATAKAAHNELLAAQNKPGITLAHVAGLQNNVNATVLAAQQSATSANNAADAADKAATAKDPGMFVIQAAAYTAQTSAGPSTDDAQPPATAIVDEITAAADAVAGEAVAAANANLPTYFDPANPAPKLDDSNGLPGVPGAVQPVIDAANAAIAAAQNPTSEIPWGKIGLGAAGLWLLSKLLRRR